MISTIAPREILHYTELPEYKKYKSRLQISRLKLAFTSLCLIAIVLASVVIGTQIERNGWLNSPTQTRTAK